MRPPRRLDLTRLQGANLADPSVLEAILADEPVTGRQREEQRRASLTPRARRRWDQASPPLPDVDRVPWPGFACFQQTIDAPLSNLLPLLDNCRIDLGQGQGVFGGTYHALQSTDVYDYDGVGRQTPYRPKTSKTAMLRAFAPASWLARTQGVSWGTAAAAIQFRGPGIKGRYFRNVYRDVLTTAALTLWAFSDVVDGLPATFLDACRFSGAKVRAAFEEARQGVSFIVTDPASMCQRNRPVDGRMIVDEGGFLGATWRFAKTDGDPNRIAVSYANTIRLCNAAQQEVGRPRAARVIVRRAREGLPRWTGTGPGSAVSRDRLERATTGDGGRKGMSGRGWRSDIRPRSPLRPPPRGSSLRGRLEHSSTLRERVRTRERQRRAEPEGRWRVPGVMASARACLVLCCTACMLPAGCTKTDPYAELWAACEPTNSYYSDRCPLELSCEDPSKTFDEAVADARTRFAGCYGVARCRTQGSTSITSGGWYCGFAEEDVWFFDGAGQLVGFFAGGMSGLSGYYNVVVEDFSACTPTSGEFEGGNQMVLFGDDAGCFDDEYSRDPSRYCLLEMEYEGQEPEFEFCADTGG